MRLTSSSVMARLPWVISWDNTGHGAAYTLMEEGKAEMSFPARGLAGVSETQHPTSGK